MNEPKLRFKDKNGVFFPSWIEKTYGDLMDGFEYGMNVAATVFDGENRYLRITDIDDESHYYSRLDEKSPSGKCEEKYLVREGDILFARTGASVGKTYLYSPADGKMYYAGYLIRGHVKPNFSPYFVFSSTLTMRYANWIKMMSRRSGQPGVNAEEYKSYSLCIPCLDEQQKIADFLSTVDEKIVLKQKKYDALIEAKKGLLQKIFSQEIRFRKYDGEEYPEWKEITLGSFVTRIKRKNIDNESDIPLTISSIDGLVDQRDYFDKIIASANMSGYYLLKRGEFAYNKSYSKGFPVGSVKRLEKYEKGALSTLYICFSVDETQFNPEFIACYFDSTFWYEQVRERCAEGARNHGLLNIGVNDFFDTKHTLPLDIEEQNKIAIFLSAFDEKIEAVRKELEGWKMVKKGLLQQMFC